MSLMVIGNYEVINIYDKDIYVVPFNIIIKWENDILDKLKNYNLNNIPEQNVNDDSNIDGSDNFSENSVNSSSKSEESIFDPEVHSLKKCNSY